MFRDYFNKNKKCKCDIDECKHFEKALVDVIGNRTNELHKKLLNIGIKTHIETIKQT